MDEEEDEERRRKEGRTTSGIGTPVGHGHGLGYRDSLAFSSGEETAVHRHSTGYGHGFEHGPVYESHQLISQPYADEDMSSNSPTP